jgi:large subunit ribosomal protein L6
MSRIGKQPIVVPVGVDVTLEAGHVAVRGPRGALSMSVPASIGVNLDGQHLVVSRPSDEKQHRSLHGLTRTLISNMVVGVTSGYRRTLDIAGVGYRVAKLGSRLSFQVGFSHPVDVAPPAGVSFEVESPTRFHVVGIDKQLVGQVAANLRGIRPPEPYLGKGIRYTEERIRRKAGKSGKAGGKK